MDFVLQNHQILVGLWMIVYCVKTQIRLNKSFGPIVYQGRPILVEREQREIYCDNFCHVTSQVSAMLEHESEPKPLKIFSPKRSAKQNQIPTFSISSILAFSFDCKINQQTRQKYVCLFLWLWLEPKYVPDVTVIRSSMKINLWHRI